MKPYQIDAIINRKYYNTDKATLLAGNDYWDGNNFERSGRNTFLYKTAKGNYFAVHQTCWQGEQDRIEPLDLDDAVELFESLTAKREYFADAFPNVEVEDA